MYISGIEMQKDSPSVPCTVNMLITCGGFSGKRSIDVSRIELIEFIHSIKYLYDNLKGEATLNEYFEYRSLVRFTCTNTGHIIINGELNEMLNHWTFETTIDQTDIREFAEKLYSNFIG